MEKDILFLLESGFLDGTGAPYFCPDCVMLEGLLALYPALNASLDVRRVVFPRPRAEIVALLGVEHQSCPVLIVAAGAALAETGIKFSTAGGLTFIDDAREIGRYLSLRHSIPRPH